MGFLVAFSHMTPFGAFSHSCLPDSVYVRCYVRMPQKKALGLTGPSQLLSALPLHPDTDGLSTSPHGILKGRWLLSSLWLLPWLTSSGSSCVHAFPKASPGLRCVRGLTDREESSLFGLQHVPQASVYPWSWHSAHRRRRQKSVSSNLQL